MAVSTAALLTKQFYEWEYRGRGHTAVDFPAELEPPFIPFFGHYIDAPYIDDGKRHTALSKLRGYFVPEHAVSVPDAPKQDVIAFPDNEENPPLTLYKIILPKNYSCKADSIEHCLNMLSACTLPMSFEIVANVSDVSLHISCRDSAASFIYAQLNAYFPDCVIQETYNDEVLHSAQEAQSVYVVDFGLQDECMRPLASYNTTHDPYTPLFGIVEQLQEYQTVIVQVLFCGVQNPWAESIITSVTDERGGSFFLDAPEMLNMAKEKTAHPLFAATVRLAAFADEMDEAQTLLHHAALALMQASVSNGNKLMPLTTPEYSIQQRLCDLVLRQSHRVGMLLNTKELATFVHFPAAQLSKKLVPNNRSTKRAPLQLHNQSYILGTNDHQGNRVEVGISLEQRFKHLHIMGATGMGKSTLMQSLVIQDIENGIGCCVLDPHGDLIDAVLRSVPLERVDDVILIDPSDGEYAVGFNILAAHSDLERELLASDLVALFKRFSTSWGDQLHSVLANAIMAFLYNTKVGHLGDLRKFLIEPQFRANILSTCTDEELTYYWQKEYPLLKTSSIGSILTRLDSFLRPKVIRAMVCQHQGLNFSQLMDDNKIILVKLSQGLIGNENSYLLGACIVSKLQQCAMARQQQKYQQRKPFFCYIDEFHQFITPSMGTILSGARKFAFGLIVAHQDMQQVQRQDTDIAGSLMSNVGTRICFRLSDTDAKRMQEGFNGFTSDDLQTLATGEAIARVNTPDADFNLSVLQAAQIDDDYTDDIIEASRIAYAVPIQSMPPKADWKEIQLDQPTNVFEAPQQSLKYEAEPEPKVVPVAAPKKEPEPKQEPSNAELKEHRYLQNFIKTMAQQHGYKADIEPPTDDGTGRVDVVIEKDRERIAIEVSVSTNAEWELHNIKKCLNGKYTKIVVCSNNQKKLQQIRQKIHESLSHEQQVLIQLITPDEIPTLFVAKEQPKETITTMKGYRVKVKYDEAAQQTNTEDIIGRIIKGARNLG